MELLVVIVLVTTLVTTAIPILSPGGDSRKLREASRAVNSFFAGARARAIETGRPYGVAIKRLSAVTGNADDNGVGVELSYVEVPPVYAGLDSGSLCRVGQFAGSAAPIKQLRLQFIRYGNDGRPNDDRLPPGYDRDAVPGSFLRPGDVVEVDGVQYSLEDPRDDRYVQVNFGDNLEKVGLVKSPEEGVTGTFAVVDGTAAWTYLILPFVEEQTVEVSLRYDAAGAVVDPNALDAPIRDELQGRAATYWAEAAPYKIYRQPVPAQGQPLQLPEGAAIDLHASGFSDGTRLHLPSNGYRQNRLSGQDGEAFADDVVIMFSPEGSISTARFRPPYNDNPDDLGPAGSTLPDETAVTSSLSLLIGRRELMPAEMDGATVPGVNAGVASTVNVDDPIDMRRYVDALEEDETLETFAKYNWLNLDSRWVVIGAQTGSITTVENSAITLPSGTGRFGMDQQLTAARANAPSRLVAGGR